MFNHIQRCLQLRIEFNTCRNLRWFTFKLLCIRVPPHPRLIPCSTNALPPKHFVMRACAKSRFAGTFSHAHPKDIFRIPGRRASPMKFRATFAVPVIVAQFNDLAHASWRVYPNAQFMTPRSENPPARSRSSPANNSETFKVAVPRRAASTRRLVSGSHRFT